jgi:hypothetical protein
LTRMESRIQILTELQEIAPSLVKRDVFPVPYQIPAGYFSDFADMLMIRIRLEAAGSSAMPEEEMTSISPLLASLQRKDTYQVPADFFDKLQVKIPSGESAKILEMQAIPAYSIDRSISQNRRRVSLPMKLVRYAAAACIVGLLGIVTFNITHHQNITDPIQGLTTVSDEDMANYLDADDIHWTPSSSAEIASTDFNDDDIHDLLKGVPDVELEQYSASLPKQKGTVN